MINDYCNNLPEDLIIYAMKDAIEHKATNLKYIKSILDRYIKQNIKTVEQLKYQEKMQKDNKFEKKETVEEQAERLKKEWGLSDDD